MTVSSRRVWRAAPRTRAAVVVFLVVVGVALPVLAHLVHHRGGAYRASGLLLLLTGLLLLYGWRFGLHPSLEATETGVVVHNPLRTSRFDWDDITVVAPGGDGLVIASADARVEAWCVQQSSRAAASGRLTRSDRVADELLQELEKRLPVDASGPVGARIRRARAHEAELLTGIERAAAEAAFAHIFKPGTHPYPVAAVRDRWQRLLRDPAVRVQVLEAQDRPVAFVAFDRDTVRHLSVLPEHARRRHGSALLALATREIFDLAEPAAQLWVLTGNEVARRFYRSAGWVESDDRRVSEFPPHPEEWRLYRPNPGAPRRSRPA